MADNTTLNPGAAGDTIATDDISGVKHQMVKVEFGVLDTATLVSTANPLPVDQTNTTVADGGTLPAKGVQVGGTDGSVFQVLSTDSAGRLNTNVNGTVPVSGPLTDTQMRATAVPVSGTVTASGPLTDTQLRATAVPVSGTVTANAGTGPFPVSDNSGSLTVDAPVATPVFVRLSDGTSAIATLPVSAASLPLPTGASTVAKQPALGTAGTPSADVLTVQGAASMTALKTDSSATTQPVSDGGGSLTVDNAGTFAVQIAANSSVNTAQVAGTATSVNSGTKDAGTQRVILASDQTVVPVSDNAGSLTVDAPVGTPVFTTATPSTTGGWSKITAVAQTTTKKVVKASAGTWGGYYVYNPNASVAYIQVFDLATGSVTLGTTAPDLVYGIPAGSAANLELANGVNMANAITLACTTTATGSTAPGTGLDLTLYFK